MSVKILHASDLHIGSPLSSMGERAEARRAELLGGLQQITRLCTAQKVDILLLAGDIFDSVQVGTEMVEVVCQALGALPNIQVFIAPGNHDPATIDSPYLLEDWPENVHIFKEAEVECIELKDLGVRVYGAGFKGEYQEKPLLSGFHAKRDDFVNLGVFHGDFAPSSVYHPITLADIGKSGLDYLALGHIHQQTGLLKEGNTYYAYAGCPEGRGFDEAGEKGVFIGDVGRGICGAKFYPLCKRQFLEIFVDISNCDTQNQILTALEEATPNPEHFYKIVLTGEVAAEVVPNLGFLQSYLSQRLYFVKLRDKTSLKIDLDLLAEEMSLKGVFAKKMRSRLQAAHSVGDREQERLLSAALKLGLQAFDGEVATHAN